MLVRKVSVKNIRSYNDGEEATLEIPEGVTLFEGDIGSGKSTLLYAIEFALFGLGDLRGSHILSEGRQTGRVSVTFESGGDEYTVERHLKAKGQDVVQDECYISSKGERARLSAGDLKERVVSILGFNEPTHPKAYSLVYRYAVFTPQEQMKEILTEDPERRMQVIRRILGAQSYQIAAENSETVERSIKDVAIGLRRQAADIQDRRDDLASVLHEASDLESKIPTMRQATADATRLVSRLDVQWRESMDQREALAKAEALLPRLRQEVSDLKEEVSGHQEDLRGLELRLHDDLEPSVKAFEAMPKPGISARDARSRLDEAQKAHTQLASAEAALERELKQTKDLISSGVCPVCKQRVSGEVTARSEHTQAELSETRAKLTSASEAIDSCTSALEKAQAYEEAESESARASKEIQRIDSEIRSSRKKHQQATEKLAARMKELDEAASQAKGMRSVSEQVAALERQLAEAREEEKGSALRLTRAESDLASKRRDSERLQDEVTKMQAALDESIRLGKYQTWISGFFRPSVKLIESQTLSQAAARFNEHFQRFFTTLVDDPDMVVRVREDFTPIFEREGFEQEYRALSGGERTSMALAYRFALNSVVRESILAQPELVILDEPTDGFSKEQVYKMRGLLDELGARQVILVSHERELESMADHVFRVEKRNGSSSVSPVVR